MDANFWDAVRAIFGGRLTKEQMAGVETILAASEGLPISHRAYLLATAKHETADTMQPITEYGGRKYFDKYDTGKLAKALGNTPEADGDGFKYRGRGFVQITGFANYKAYGLQDNPDKALELGTATLILINGMTTGTFTGKKLSDYFSGPKADWINARRIINGTARAADIAAIGQKLLKAIEVA